MEFIKKNTFVILFVMFLFIVSVFPQIFKELFVEKSGKIEVIGYTFGGLLSILILLKWRHVKILFNVVLILSCFTDIIILSLVSQKYFVNTFCLFIAHAVILIVFNYSKKVNEYLI